LLQPPQLFESIVVSVHVPWQMGHCPGHWQVPPFATPLQISFETMHAPQAAPP
jgi:hypothetical protein